MAPLHFPRFLVRASDESPQTDPGSVLRPKGPKRATNPPLFPDFFSASSFVLLPLFSSLRIPFRYYSTFFVMIPVFLRSSYHGSHILKIVFTYVHTINNRSSSSPFSFPLLYLSPTLPPLGVMWDSILCDSAFGRPATAVLPSTPPPSIPYGTVSAPSAPPRRQEGHDAASCCCCCCMQRPWRRGPEAPRASLSFSAWRGGGGGRRGCCLVGRGPQHSPSRAPSTASSRVTGGPVQ